MASRRNQTFRRRLSKGEPDFGGGKPLARNQRFIVEVTWGPAGKVSKELGRDGTGWTVQ